MRLFKVEEDIWVNTEQIILIARVRGFETERTVMVTADDREFRFTESPNDLIERIEHESIVL